jgi:hypothetical protein
MLHPTATTLRPTRDASQSANGYFLSDVCLDIPSADTAIFKAKLNGPAGSQVWTRAWLSNETDGTLAEAASARLNAGDVATLTVILSDPRVPENAFIRIESAPLATEQVVAIILPQR